MYIITVLKTFVWVYLTTKVWFIFYKVQLRCELTVLYEFTIVLYETSKLNKVQLCMEHSYLSKQHHLECVNKPETVNNSMQLCFNFPFLEAFCMNKPFINERENTI